MWRKTLDLVERLDQDPYSVLDGLAQPFTLTATVRRIILCHARVIELFLSLGDSDISLTYANKAETYCSAMRKTPSPSPFLA
jgi:hypothetical protein